MKEVGSVPAPQIWLPFAVAVIVLWANGYMWRLTWEDKPKLLPLEDYPLVGDSVSTAIVYATGAFNSGLCHSPGMAKLWRQYGDVYVVEYPLRRFNTELTAHTIWEQLPYRYEHVVLIGMSMGGIVSLRAKAELGLAPENVSFIGVSVPQCCDHIAWPARLVRFIHPGPILNLLSGLTRFIFRVLEDKVSPGTDMELLHRHIAAMRQFRLSAIRDQLAAICDSKIAPPEEFDGIRSVYVYSEEDAVIKNDLARDAWHHTFPDAVDVCVPGTMHGSFMENEPEFRLAFEQAFSALELPIIR